MKCSVCAQDIPEDRYSEHLETEHGVTDDPTAVLIQHLTGLHSTGTDNGEDDEHDEDEGDLQDEDETGLPDDEPSDADAFEEFLAAHPPPAKAQEPEPEAGEDKEEAPEPEPAPVDEEGPDEQAEGEEPEDEEGDSLEDSGEELTDEDEAEFERMLAVYPEVDLRKGRPEPVEEKTDAAAESKTTEMPAAAGAAAAGAAAGAAGASGDRDETTFAVWDQARGEGEGQPDGDVLVVAPSAEQEKARRRRQTALLGLGAAIILAAIAIIYLLTRDTGTNNTTATAPLPSTTPTTVAPTFLPGPPGGAATTTVPVTQPPVATTAPAAPVITAAPPPPPVDPASKIAFSYSGATCTPQGQFTVFGSVTNTNSATYSVQYTITYGSQGTANGSVAHLPPGGQFTGTPTDGIAKGTCNYPLTQGPRPTQRVTVTPG